MKSGKKAVILANLGWPTTLNEVRPFLKNLFGDPDIFRLPFGNIGQKIFSSLIASFRSPKSQKYYAAVGGGSPIYENTLAQADKLQKALYAEKVSTSLGTGIADSAEQILEEAEKLSQMDPQKAIEVYQRILFEYPTSRFVPHALMAVANSYDTRLNDLENSLIFYERLMQDFPASEQARFVEARYQELRRLQESFADTSRTTAVDTDEN